MTCNKCCRNRFYGKFLWTGGGGGGEGVNKVTISWALSHQGGSETRVRNAIFHKTMCNFKIIM